MDPAVFKVFPEDSCPIPHNVFGPGLLWKLGGEGRGGQALLPICFLC